MNNKEQLRIEFIQWLKQQWEWTHLWPKFLASLEDEE